MISPPATPAAPATSPLSLDALIIGHGLAGAVLAHTLVEAGWKVLVVDTPDPDSASRVAAGLVNPLAGRRFALTWRAEELLPAAAAFYQEVEKRLGTAPLWHGRPIWKLFPSVAEANAGLAKAESPFVIGTLPPQDSPELKAPLGGLILGGGFLLTEPLLDALRAHRISKNEYRAEAVDTAKLQPTETGVGYTLADGTTLSARFAICCLGVAAAADAWFGWLPFTPNAGEVLDVALPPAGLPPDTVLNQSVYVVPQPGGLGHYRVGATYDWRSPPPARPTEAGRADLLERLARLVPPAPTVLAHRAARRPAVQDRRPLLGPHPAHPRVWIFNGFGSKGVGLAPGLATHLLGVLEGRETLWPEVNLARFAALYPESGRMA